MPPILQVLSGATAGHQYALTADPIRMGRHPSCEVVIDLNSVSRFHAQLVKEADGYAIEDLKSRNGTFVNGKRIDGRTTLVDNDRVKICDMLLVYRDGDSTGLPLPPIPAEEVADDESGSTILKTIDARLSSDLMLKVKPEAKLRAILEISQAVGQSLNLDDIFTKMLDSLFKIFPQADRGMVILEAEPNQLRVRAVKQRHDADEESVRFSRTILRQAMTQRAAILSADAASDERFSMSQSIADYRIRSVMCAPLLTQEGTALGVIQVDTQNFHQKFEEDDLQILQAVASQVSISIENARLHEAQMSQARIKQELEFAKIVQTGFLPKRTPPVPGYSFWTYYESAGAIGGDFFGFLPLPGGRVATFVADVSGKGVPAALLMAKSSADFRVGLLSEPDDLAAALRKINVAFSEAQLDDRFITAILCVIDPAREKMTIASAGHMSPLVRRRGGEVIEPINDVVTGLPLGVYDDFEYEAVECDIGPGEAVVLYTDGISEAMNGSGQLYGVERLTRSLSQVDLAADKLGEFLLRDVREHVAGHAQSDDMTIVVFTRETA